MKFFLEKNTKNLYYVIFIVDIRLVVESDFESRIDNPTRVRLSIFKVRNDLNPD